MSTNEATKRPRGTEDWAEPKAIIVQRDADRDLRLTGWLIGKGEEGTGGSSGYSNDWTRGVKVRVWLSEGGSVVVGRYRWSRWQGETDHYSAEVLDPCGDGMGGCLMLELRDDDGEFGTAAKEAWESSCAKWPPLEADQEELVDEHDDEPEPVRAYSLRIAWADGRTDRFDDVREGSTVVVGKLDAAMHTTVPLHEGIRLLCMVTVHGTELPSMVLVPEADEATTGGAK